MLWFRGALVGVAAASVLLVGCGSDASKSQATSGAGTRTVQVKLDFTPVQGFMLPVVVAAEKGYYKQAGFDVNITEGQDSTSTIAAVDSGHADIGFADAGQTALAVSKGAHVKVIADYLQKTQGVVIARQTEHIDKPQALVGKTIGATEGSSSGAMLSALVKKAGIASGQVKVQSVSSEAKVASLVQGKVDGITGFATSECVQAKQSIHEPVTCMPVSDYGVTVLGEGLVASDDFIQAHRDLLAKFVEATNRGWADALADPAAAAEAGVKQFPLADKDLLESQLKAVRPYLHTDTTQGKPYGYMAKSDWTATLGFLHAYRELSPEGSPSDYYLNVVA